MNMFLISIIVTSLDGLSPAGAWIYWVSVAGWMFSSARRI